MTTCAVIPAAGRGTRLGMDLPKILARVTPARTIWDLLRERLTPLVDHIQLVISPDGARHLAPPPGVSVAIQRTPLGMGDAVFCGREEWSEFERILVVWGDQVNLSRSTLERALRLHSSLPAPACAIPLVLLDKPYVQYDFNGGPLWRIRQTREGDVTDDRGYSDAGLFVLSTRGLTGLWERYLATAKPGSQTAEINFLPFLVYLAQVAHWPQGTFEIQDPGEARGVNTAADLEFARQMANSSH